MKYLLPLFLILSVITSSCRRKSVNCGLDCGTQSEELLFQTGFYLTQLSNGEYFNVEIYGTDDNLTGNNAWSQFIDHPKVGFVEIGYEDGNDTQRLASVVDDPDDVGNKVMKFRLLEPHIKEGKDYKGRVQLSVHDNNCMKEIYQTVRLKLHPDMMGFQERSNRLYWFTLAEF